LVTGSETIDCQSFAVHLAEDAEKQMGIILAGSASQDLDGSILLSKFGAYEIADDDAAMNGILRRGQWLQLPKAQNVDWVAI